MKVFLNDFQGIMPKLNPRFLNQKIQNAKAKFSKTSCCQIRHDFELQFCISHLKSDFLLHNVRLVFWYDKRLIFKTHFSLPNGTHCISVADDLPQFFLSDNWTHPHWGYKYAFTQNFNGGKKSYEFLKFAKKNLFLCHIFQNLKFLRKKKFR